MFCRLRVSLGALIVLASALTGYAQSSGAAGRKSLVLVFTDGHQKVYSVDSISRIEFRNDTMILTQRGHEQNVAISDLARIDFNLAANSSAPRGRNYFVGKWRCGQGNGMDFYITLKPNGEAMKSVGAIHGTWVVVDGEARVAWDDGWHDVIRKVGSKNEKFAYEPGRSLEDDPSNVTNAVNLEAKPI